MIAPDDFSTPNDIAEAVERYGDASFKHGRSLESAMRAPREHAAAYSEAADKTHRDMEAAETVLLKLIRDAIKLPALNGKGEGETHG